MIKLSYSSKSSLSCPRLYFLQNILGLEPSRGSNPMRFGATWHAYLQGYYNHIRDNGWSQDGGAIVQAGKYGSMEWDKYTLQYDFSESDTYLTQQTLGECFLEYITEFYEDEEMLEVLEVEQFFEVTFPLSNSDKKVYTYLDELVYRGKIDLQASLGGANWIIEFKTTGWSLPLLIKQLDRSPQILSYQVCGNILNHQIGGCLVPILYITSRRKKDGEYGKVSRQLRRVPRIFSEQDMEQWIKSLYGDADYLAYLTKQDVWPMQFECCGDFGGCNFTDICTMLPDLDEVRNREEPLDGFKYRVRAPEENKVYGTYDK